jgi:hypothetical protein
MAAQRYQARRSHAIVAATTKHRVKRLAIPLSADRIVAANAMAVVAEADATSAMRKQPTADVLAGSIRPKLCSLQ